MNYQIISDGCCDLTADIISKYRLHIIPFYISFDEKNYYKEIEEIGIREVYDRMVGNPDVYPKTSLPSVQNYVDVFIKYVKQGIPIICLCFTVSLSGSVNSALNAKKIVEEEYPDAKICVYDSQSGTVSQALMVIEAGRMLLDGVPYEKCVEILDVMRNSSYIFFSVGNLDYFRHGGRIGKLAGMAVDALSLKPLIVLDHGVVTPGGIARSRKKSFSKIFDLFKKYLSENNEDINDYSYLIGYGYDIEEGEKFRSYMEKEMRKLGLNDSEPVSSLQIGATIAVHTGPFAIGFGCVKKYEKFL